MIEVRGLTFDYPGIRALDDVTFTIEPGTVTALVGPNGAGKTTCMRCVAGLDEPLHGAIVVGGDDGRARPRDAHELMGVLYDFYGLYDDLTVVQCLRHRAGAQGVPGPEREARVERAAERMKVTARMGQKAGTLSRGWRQRLSIALNIVHEPKLLMMDEPASGLDPEARADLSAVLRQLHAEGMTIVVSSHILSELEDYSTHMLAIENGRITAHKALDVSAVGGQAMTLALTFATPPTDLDAHLDEATLTAQDGARATVTVDPDPAKRAALVQRLVAAGLPLIGVEPVRARLSEQYLETRKARPATEEGA